jgi:stage II sporulation protein AA (anti-sigma F factor antagonist)
MKVEATELGADIQHVKLEGRLDVAGAEAADLRLNALAAGRKGNFVLDLSGVSILASIGIRLLITVARAQKGRGGSIVLCSPQPLVRDTLISGSVDQLIPLYDTVDLARASFAPG